MSNFCEYYLYQKYEKVGDGEWTPTYPNEYSISGDTENPMPLVVKRCESPACGYRDPIYRWADTEDTICVFEDEHDYSQDYLTIESLEDNNVIYWKTSQWHADYPPTPKTISASTDNGTTWVAYTPTTGNGTTIATLNAGDKVLIKGENTTYNGVDYPTVNNAFNSSKRYQVYGNIMSMVSGDSFQNVDRLTATRTFAALFYGSAYLVSAKNLILPAVSLTDECYIYMFKFCSNLVEAPSMLPAITLTDWCYSGMFERCRSLTTAPKISATTLAEYCCFQMFYDCSNLTTAPELSAATLEKYCYGGMFDNCSNLNYIKCLATDISASLSTSGWVNGVSSTGTFVKAANATWNVIGPNGIPSGWTVQNA